MHGIALFCKIDPCDLRIHYIVFFPAVNAIIVVLIGIVFLIVVHRNLLNLNDFARTDVSGNSFAI